MKIEIEVRYDKGNYCHCIEIWQVLPQGRFYWLIKWLLERIGAETAKITGIEVNQLKRDKYMKIENKSKIARVRNDGRWHSRGSDWSTPQILFDKLDDEFHFTLDVCASGWNKKCDRYFSEKEDGLKQDWGKNICWMNPPYGKVLNEWMKKAFESSSKGATVVCLVPSATDTAWWHDYSLRGEIRYLRGRPRFETKEGNWQQTFSPSVIVIFK